MNETSTETTTPSPEVERLKTLNRYLRAQLREKAIEPIIWTSALVQPGQTIHTDDGEEAIPPGWYVYGHGKDDEDDVGCRAVIFVEYAVNGDGENCAADLADALMKTLGAMGGLNRSLGVNT